MQHRLMQPDRDRVHVLGVARQGEVAPALGDVPQHDLAISSARHEDLAVVAERQAQHAVGKAAQAHSAAPAGNVPQRDSWPLVSHRERSSVRLKARLSTVTTSGSRNVARRRRRGTSQRIVPAPESDRQRAAVATQREARERATALDACHAPASRDVPQVHRPEIGRHSNRPSARRRGYDGRRSAVRLRSHGAAPDVATFHSTTVPPSEIVSPPVATRRPSGLIAAPVTIPRRPGSTARRAL